MQSHYSRTAEFCELVEINAKCQNRRRTILMSVRQIGQPLPIRFRWVASCTRYAVVPHWRYCAMWHDLSIRLIRYLLTRTTNSFKHITHPQTTLIMLRLAAHTHDVPVFSSPAFSILVFSVAPRARMPRGAWLRDPLTASCSKSKKISRKCSSGTLGFE